VFYLLTFLFSTLFVFVITFNTFKAMNRVGAALSGQMVLDNVQLKQKKGMPAMNSQRGVKQELDAIIADITRLDVCMVLCIVECKVNLRAALTDADKFATIEELIRSGTCVLSQPCGPFKAGTPVLIAKNLDIPLVYFGAQDDFREVCVLVVESSLVAESVSFSCRVRNCMRVVREMYTCRN
jgi:hypothetical protein